MTNSPDISTLYRRFIESRHERRMSPRTIEWYGWTLGPFVAAMPAHPTPDDIQSYLATAPSAETARNWIRAIRAMYNWGSRHPRYWENPAQWVEKPRAQRRLPRVLTTAEIRQLYQAALGNAVNLAAITTLLDTGVRIGELASLQAEDISPKEIRVRGKTGGRVLPISPESYKALMHIAPLRGAVFVTQQGPERPMAVATLNLRVRDCFRKAGITGRKVGPHTLRHTFATLYLRGGGDLYRLQRILGHTHLAQTSEYLHLADHDAFSEHAQFSPLRDLLGPTGPVSVAPPAPTPTPPPERRDNPAVAIREVDGEKYEIGTKRALTPQKRAVLLRIAEGKTDYEIGLELGIFTQSVRSHVLAMQQKLEACDRHELVREALKRGIIRRVGADDDPDLPTAEGAMWEAEKLLGWNDQPS